MKGYIIFADDRDQALVVAKELGVSKFFRYGYEKLDIVCLDPDHFEVVVTTDTARTHPYDVTRKNAAARYAKAKGFSVMHYTVRRPAR